MKTQPTDLGAPWHLRFDRNGTEDIAVICDTDGYDLAYSAEFWLPDEDQPEPSALRAARLMTAAPELFEALDLMLEQTVDMDLKHGLALTQGERLARRKARKAVRKARGV